MQFFKALTKELFRYLFNNGNFARIIVGLTFIGSCFVWLKYGALHGLGPNGGNLKFLQGLGALYWFFPLVKTVEFASGILLLTNRYKPLALAMLAPIVLCIMGFHSLSHASGGFFAYLILGFYLWLVWRERKSLAFLLKK